MKEILVPISFLDIVGDKDWEEKAIEYTKQVVEDRIREEFEKERKSAPIWSELDPIKGFWIEGDCSMSEYTDLGLRNDSDKNVFLTKKHAKAALAMAQISQLMPYYGGEITKDEWSNVYITKYTVVRKEHTLQSCNTRSYYEPIAFRTEKDRIKFMSHEENVRLVKDYYMMD